MEIRLLGTAAAEGYPAIACPCKHCGVARERGGRNLRKRSHVLVDGTHPVADVSATIKSAAIRFGDAGSLSGE